MAASLFGVQEKLRVQLRAAGAKSVRALGFALRTLGDGGAVSLEQMIELLRDAGADLADSDYQKLAEAHSDSGGMISVPELLDGIWGRVPDTRLQLIYKAFSAIDKGHRGEVSLQDLSSRYNAKCHPACMEERMSEDEVLQRFLDNSFGQLDVITPVEFCQYYTQVSCSTRSDELFELIIMKDWKVAADGTHVDDVEREIKTKVYKNRIRVKEFFVDFDKLRSGYITANQLQSGLSTAGIALREREMKAVADKYRNPSDGQLRVHYRAFCDEMDSAFTAKDLEKQPWKDVPMRPDDLLEMDRFKRAGRYLGAEKEQRLESVMNRLRRDCRIRRILVKPFFDDAVNTKNAAKMVGHVTSLQFKQTLNGKIGLHVRDDECDLIIEKFDSKGTGMVNYIAFSNAVDPGDEEA
eukprot:jgi/Mesvir1/3778/Mv08225-RA.1